jgi:protein AbiQ
MKMQWKVLNDAYLDYLRNKYESRIPYSYYGEDKFKPFFGSLFEINDMVYVTQISHPQDRHIKLKQNIDFYKIYHPDDGRLISVINLNYMFPIYKSLLIDIKYKDIHKHRTFINDEAKSKYIDLLNTELKIINELPIAENAVKIYDNKYKYPDDKVAKRSFDFKKLEQACIKYQALKEIADSQEQAASGKNIRPL